MKLVIAEKPSVSLALSAVLGAKRRGDGYMEGNGYIVQRVNMVLASTVSQMEYDLRFSRDNRDWAKAFPRLEGDGLTLKSHPVKLDSFINQARRGATVKDALRWCGNEFIEVPEGLSESEWNQRTETYLSASEIDWKEVSEEED